MSALVDWDSTPQLRDDVARLLKQFPDSNIFLSQFVEKLDDLLLRNNCVSPSKSIVQPFIHVVTSLYNAEGFTAPPPFSSAIINTLEGARYRDHLLDLHRKATRASTTLDGMYWTLSNSLLGLMRELPALAFDQSEGTTTVPLLEIIDVPKAVSSVTAPFLNEGLNLLGIFAAIRTQLSKNILEASKGNSKKLIRPDDYEGTPKEIVHAYLKDTPLQALFDARIPFSIPDETRFSGQWIIAPPGRGKTTLLHSMFVDDVDRDASIIIMDSKGDLINPIKSIAAIADRLVLIEPDVQHPLALNPLDVASENIPHTIALIEYILSGLLDAKFTNLQSALFRHVLPAIMQAIPHPTIEDLKRVLADGLPSTNKLDARLQQFFSDRNSGFHSKTYAETRSQIIWRLDFILTNDTMRAMFASPTTRLKIADAMNSGKIIVIDASKAILGDDGSEFYQRFFLALILAAAQQRAKLKPSEKLPVYCYLDECQWVRNDQKLATILDECRSQKIGLILAHQRTEQITDKNVLSAMSNCAIRFANSDDEARYLAPKLRCEPEFLHSLPRGTFAAFVRDLTPHAIALKVPYTNLEALPRMTAGQQASIRQRMRAEYGFIAQPRSVPPIVAEATPPPSAGQTLSTAASPPERPRPASDAPESGSTW